jgi:MFS family permease
MSFLAAGVWWHLLLIVPFFAIFNGLTTANITALVSKSAGPEVQGEVLGLNSSVQALAQSIPPVLSGYLAGTLHPDAPLMAAGITIITAGILFILYYRPSHKLT